MLVLLPGEPANPSIHVQGKSYSSNQDAVCQLGICVFYSTGMFDTGQSAIIPALIADK